MRERRIKVDPFDFLNYKSINIQKKVCNHGTAEISGIVSSENANMYIENFKPNQKITISILNENNLAETIFSGILTDMNILNRGDVNVLSISVISHSYKMDVKRHTRTFQDHNAVYRDVTKTVTSDSGIGDIINPKFGGNKIGKMFVQYMETDWEFANRLASRLNTIVVPDHKLNSPMISIGMPESPKGSSNPYFEEYSFGINNELLLISREFGLDIDAKYYTGKSREALDLCAPVNIMEEQVYVYSVITKLENGELIHLYELQRKKGFKQKEYFNQPIIGGSLTGNVVDVEKDSVCVKIQNDVEQTNYKWFSYATVYSSPDNTGWYFMPEIGDEIKLHFPTEKEFKAYVMSSVHLQERDEADIKSIRTKYGKEIVFSPDSVYINNGSGSSILLDDNSGINIKTNKNMNVTASGDISFGAGGKISIIGNNGVRLAQSENMIQVEDTIDISAGHVRMR